MTPKPRRHRTADVSRRPGTTPRTPRTTPDAPDTPTARKLRLFVALDLPDRVRAGLAAWGSRTLDPAALRAVRPEALHVTLAFLGWLPEARVAEAAAIVCAAPSRAVPMRLLAEPVPLPARRPRLIALGLESSAAVALHEGLTPELVAAGLYERERRPFWPHVTVARVRKGRRGRAPAALPDDLLQPFGAVRVCLYRSQLRPDGAEYVSLASLDLPPAATEPGAEER